MFGKGRLFAMTATLSFVGYCIYYDRKRRLDAQYKFKVHQRRLGERSIFETVHEAFIQEPYNALKGGSKVEYVPAPLNILDKYNRLISPVYQKTREVTEQLKVFNRFQMDNFTLKDKCRMVNYLLRHVYLGENYVRRGQYRRAVRHFVYSLLICADPGILFVKLHNALPNEVFCRILRTVDAYIQANGASTIDIESSESSYADDLSIYQN